MEAKNKPPGRGAGNNKSVPVLNSITPETSLSQAALLYAEAGIPVFPLVPKTKFPRKGSHGFLDATTGTAIIQGWWNENPNYNIGIPTGEVSGITVVDIDGPEAKPGELPETAVVSSGRVDGGTHHWYEYEPGTNTVTNIRHKVDRKSDGGFVVAPPSVHKTGKRYQFTNLAPLAPLPVWAKTDTQKLESNHDDLREWSVKLARSGMDEELLCETLQHIAKTRGDGKRPDAEIRRLVESALQKFGRSPAHFSFTDVTAIDIQPADWAVENLILSDALNSIFGESETGKSFLAVEIACCVATGTPFHGRESKPGTVLYIAGEGRNGIRKRVEAWKIARQQEIHSDRLYVSDMPASLTNRVDDVIAGIQKIVTDPVLIVIDTVSMNFGQGSESQDMKIFMEAVNRIRSTFTCAVLTIHHPGHTEKNRARGGSEYHAGLDVEYILTMGQDGKRRLECKKMKDYQHPDHEAFTLAIVEVGDDETSCVMNPATWTPETGTGKKTDWPTVVELALETVTVNGQCAYSEWKEECSRRSVPRQRFADARTIMEERGDIEIKKATGNSYKGATVHVLKEPDF